MYLQNDTKKIEMDLVEETSFINSRIGRKPIFSKNVDIRMQGRGNPLMSRKRICTMEDIDKKILEMRYNGTRKNNRDKQFYVIRTIRIAQYNF